MDWGQALGDVNWWAVLAAALLSFAVGALWYGSALPKAAKKADWGGYSGYFADPDGHLWQVAHNPWFPLDDGGSVVLPE